MGIKRPMHFNILVAGLFVSTLVACNSANLPPQVRTGNNAATGTDACAPGLGFQDIQPILTRSCVGCHGGNARTALTNYTEVFALRDRIKIQVESGGMPIGSTLDRNSKSAIINWVNAGAPELGESKTCVTDPNTDPGRNPDPIEPGPKPLEATYEGIKTSFLAAKCIGCHQSGGPGQLYDFSSYNAMMGVFEFIDDDLFNVEKPEKSSIVKSVRGDGQRLMPPSRTNIPPLDEEQIQLLISWISKSMPEK